MTKKEIIIKAWMDLNIETPFGICDKTGWMHGHFCNGIDDIESQYGKEITDLINYDIDMSGVGKFRPKSLEGIEENNGWIKIESESDLPKENNLDCYVFRNGELEMATFDNETKKFYDFETAYDRRLKYVTHYQPILKPDLPLY